jgi:hypothetical protein
MCRGTATERAVGTGQDRYLVTAEHLVDLLLELRGLGQSEHIYIRSLYKRACCSVQRRERWIVFFSWNEGGHLCEFEELVHRLRGGLLPRVVEVDAFELPGKPA